MNEQVEECRIKALECERRAMVVDNEQTKLMYLELADKWRAVARLIEERDAHDNRVIH